MNYWDISAYCAFALLASFALLGGNFAYNDFGTIDFLEYWTAFRLAANGLDPYSYENMLSAQQALAQTIKVPTMMWNPPHLLPILAPILRFDFSTAAALFCAAGLTSTALTLWLVCKLLDASPGQRGRIWFLGLSFPAILTCLNIGQLGNFLALALFTGILLYNSGRYLLAGACFALCSVKPHLFLLVIAIFILNDLVHRRSGTILGGILMLAPLLAITQLMFPGIFEQWSYAIQHPDQFRVFNLYNWRPATLVGLFRVLYWRLTDLPMPLTPMWLFPLINFLFWIAICIRIGTERVIKDYLPELILCSVLFSPYGWLFDQTFLLFAWGWAYLRFESILGQRRLLALVLAMAAMSMTFIMIILAGLVSESFVGITLLILVCVLSMRRLVRPPPQAVLLANSAATPHPR